MNWPIGTVGDCIASITGGTSVSGDDLPATHGEPGVLRTSAVSGGSFRPEENKRIAQRDIHRATAPVQRGSIIINRSNTSALVGMSVFVDEDYPDRFLSDKLWALRVRDGIDPGWLQAALSAPVTRRFLRANATGSSAGMKNISMDVLRSARVTIPPIASQNTVARAMRAWDSAIAANGRLRDQAGVRYEALLDKLTRATPINPIGIATTELIGRNVRRLGASVVMGVSNRSGVVPMRARTIAADLSRYLVLPPKAFAYNPMRIDVGSIAMSRLTQEVLVSPDYVVFSCDENRLLPSYLAHVINTRRWGHDVRRGASGSVRSRTYYADLAAIRIPMPPINKQRGIAMALDTIRREIELLDQRSVLLQEQKRGLAQKLLSEDMTGRS